MKISVCMATHNGSKYIEKQILSILNQLRNEDELIIVDDDSKDHTVKIIESFADSRIVLIKNEFNQGVIKTFEKSLQAATGQLIFLSDQDDIWFPHKISKFIEAFTSNPDVTLVLSDAEIIDSQNQLISDSFFKIRGKFNPKVVPNIIKSKYHGCTIAFRKEMLNLLLPFPKDIPMHDIWIGIVNGIYGKALYIEEPLIQHRRHHNNTGKGPTKHTSFFQMLKWRYALIKNIIKLIYKHRYSKLTLLPFDVES